MLARTPMSLPPTNFETASYSDPQPPVVAPVALPGAAMDAPDPAALPYAVALGLGGAALGGLLYAGFIHATHIRIGYLSIVVAFVVAKAMMVGSRGRGGFPYQVLAITLTALAVAVGNAAMLYWDLAKDHSVDVTLEVLLRLFFFGLVEPVLEFAVSPLHAVIGLVILFVGFRAAWRMTSGDPQAVRHPFSR